MTITQATELTMAKIIEERTRDTQRRIAMNIAKKMAMRREIEEKAKQN